MDCVRTAARNRKTIEHARQINAPYGQWNQPYSGYGTIASRTTMHGSQSRGIRTKWSVVRARCPPLLAAAGTPTLGAVLHIGGNHHPHGFFPRGDVLVMLGMVFGVVAIAIIQFGVDIVCQG